LGRWSDWRVVAERRRAGTNKKKKNKKIKKQKNKKELEQGYEYDFKEE
jgi:hypothetical protein